LKDINLAATLGEIRAIIGPNGAGKRSLLHVISGIYRPQRGLVSGLTSKICLGTDPETSAARQCPNISKSRALEGS
jgi:ABC-type branched-subunit amino acid transport system ATPase component